MPDTPMPGMPLPPDQFQAPIPSPGVEPAPEPRLPHWLALRNLKADIAGHVVSHHADAVAKAREHLDQVRQNAAPGDPELEQARANDKSRMFALADAHKSQQ